MEEVAVATLGAGTPEEQAANGRLPALDGAELAADWPAGIPAAVEQRPGLLCFFHTVVLDVDVASQVGLEVAADAQLAHSAHPPQLPEHVPEEVLEVCLQLALVRLQGVVPVVRLQGQVAVQAPQQQRPAALRHRVRPRAAVPKAAGPSLEEERAGLLRRPVGAGRGRRVVPAALPARPRGRLRGGRRGGRGLGQLCQDLLQAVLLGDFFRMVGWRRLLAAAGKLALCLRFPLQPELVLTLPFRLWQPSLVPTAVAEQENSLPWSALSSHNSEVAGHPLVCSLSWPPCSAAAAAAASPTVAALLNKAAGLGTQRLQGS